MASHREIASFLCLTLLRTLQELLAPKRVLFFDAGFACLGEKTQLVSLISQASWIPKEYVVASPSEIRKACVAERMKWASGREATRIEDRAYSKYKRPNNDGCNIDSVEQLLD